MKVIFISIVLTLISCSTLKQNVDKYEIAYNRITEKNRNIKPFFNDYGSDASGTKIIPKIYKYKGVYKDFISENDFKNSKELEKLSKKYSKPNWRKDHEHRLLMPNEVKNFHGPLDYIYFTEIKNDTLKAQILGNPNGKYQMTTGQNFLIVFEDEKIKSVKEWKNYYD